MTDATPTSEPVPTAPLAARRARASRRMRVLSTVCVALALTAAGEQVAVRGWGAFIARPAGVGASETPEGDDEVAADAPDDAAEAPIADDAVPADDAAPADGAAAAVAPADAPPAPRPAPPPPRRREGRRPPRRADPPRNETATGR